MAVVDQQEATADTTSARREKARPRKAKTWRDRWPPLAAVVGILVLWELIVVGFEVPTFIAPGPGEVVATMIERWPMLMRNLWPTALESLAGFALGNTIAVLIAVGFVHSRLAERAFYPIAVFINTIPIIAIAPILVLIFGNGFTPKIIIAALICFFPTLVNVTRGLKAVNPATLELMHVLSASRWEVLIRVRLPSSLPFLFAALKIASTTCVIGAIVGEWIGSNVGLGALIIEATYNFRSPLLYATVILAASLAVVLFTIVTLLERRLIRWKVDAAAV